MVFESYGPDEARIVLSGEKAEAGIGLAVLGRVANALADALRANARAKSGLPSRRTGTTSALDEAVTDLRLVAVEPGSTQLVVRAPASEGIAAEHIALQNLRSMVRGLEDGTAEVDVVDALERGLASLGRDGSIRFPFDHRSLTVDRVFTGEFRAKARQLQPGPVRAVGRLRALDLDRTRIGIRSPDGTEWACSYPAELASRVIDAINRIVVAEGTGFRSSGLKGRIEISRLDVVPEAVQTSLFSLEPRSLGELIEEQDVVAGWGASLAPEHVSEEEIDRFLEALRKV